MPGPQHANPAGSIQVACEQFALPLETPPHEAERVSEKIGVPRESLDEAAEMRTRA